MKKNEISLVDLSLDELSTINGGTFAEDAGILIGFSIKFNLKVQLFAMDPLFLWHNK